MGKKESPSKDVDHDHKSGYGESSSNPPIQGSEMKSNTKSLWQDPWSSEEDSEGMPSNDFCASPHQVFQPTKGDLTMASEISQFSASQSCQYYKYFEERSYLGDGSYGQVVLCWNKLDKSMYAIKKIPLKDKTKFQKISREATALASLQHRHVVRYYQAWVETEFEDYDDGSNRDTRTTTSSEAIGSENRLESTYLFIQMEQCAKTLKEGLKDADVQLKWIWFRQILEALEHIHETGIIHLDLKPDNIFLRANDIKVGDFGLAMFLEPVSPQPADTTEVSSDDTHESIKKSVKCLYTAPEIDNGWAKIDCKADMYSLGVILYEFFHPMKTEAERRGTLSTLKREGKLDWVAEFPEHGSSLFQKLISSDPSKRPSATELLKDALLFPPQEESKLLDGKFL